MELYNWEVVGSILTATMEWNVRVVVVMAACAVVIAEIVRIIRLVWWRPRKIQMHFQSQGIRGPPYKLFLGNAKEMMKMMQQASSNPMGYFSHDILPRVLSFYHQRRWKGSKHFIELKAKVWGGNIHELCSFTVLNKHLFFTCSIIEELIWIWSLYLHVLYYIWKDSCRENDLDALLYCTSFSFLNLYGFSYSYYTVCYIDYIFHLNIQLVAIFLCLLYQDIPSHQDCKFFLQIL